MIRIAPSAGHQTLLVAKRLDRPNQPALPVDTRDIPKLSGEVIHNGDMWILVRVVMVLEVEGVVV